MPLINEGECGLQTGENRAQLRFSALRRSVQFVSPLCLILIKVRQVVAWDSIFTVQFTLFMKRRGLIGRSMRFTSPDSWLVIEPLLVLHQLIKARAVPVRRRGLILLQSGFLIWQRTVHQAW